MCSNIPPITNQSILPRHRLRRNNTLTPRNQPPTTRPKRAIQDAPVLDLRQIQDTIGLDLDLFGICWCEEDISRFLGERSRTKTMERARPINLLLRGGLQLEGFVAEPCLGDIGCCGLVGSRRDDA